MKIREFMETIRSKAILYSNALSAEDPRFNRTTNIKHFDGDDLLRNSFAVRYKEEGFPELVVVISEHYGVRVYVEDDLLSTIQLAGCDYEGMLEHSIPIEYHTLDNEI